VGHEAWNLPGIALNLPISIHARMGVLMICAKSDDGIMFFARLQLVCLPDKHHRYQSDNKSPSCISAFTDNSVIAIVFTVPDNRHAVAQSERERNDLFPSAE
jgi:hypothetical protein